MEIRTEEGTIDLNFDPKKYSTKAGAAKALYKALHKLAVEMGYWADEVFIRTPEENKAAGYSALWHVSWESGPYEWAIYASHEIHNAVAGWYTEPYYSFNLEFAE